jgi:hypothetical protein
MDNRTLLKPDIRGVAAAVLVSATQRSTDTMVLSS